MAPSIRSSRDSWASRGRRLKLSQRGDPQKRPVLIRIYGLIGSLIVTIALIVLLIILQKKLPDGSNSSFHIPSRRNLENVPAQQGHHEVARWQENVLKSTYALPRTTNFADINTVEKRLAELEPRITLAPTFIPETIFHLSLGCYSTKTNCVTERFPDKLNKRYQEVTCRSTVVATPCSTSTSSSLILLPIKSPIRFSRPPIIAPIPTPTPTATCIRGISYNISCTTEPVILKAKRQGATTSCSLLRVGICTTSTSTTPTPTSSTSVPTPTPTCIRGVSLGIACTTTYHNILKAKRQLEISCSTSTLGPCSTSSSSQTSTSSSVTTPPVSVSSNSCAATAVSCSTYRNSDGRFETSCATSYSSMAGCPSSSSSSSIITTNSSSSTSSASSTLSLTSSSSIITTNSSSSTSSTSSTLSLTSSSSITTTNSSSSTSSTSSTLSPTSSSSIITTNSSSSTSSASSTLPLTSSSSITTTNSSSSTSSASSTLSPTSSSSIITTNSSSSTSSASSTLSLTSSSSITTTNSSSSTSSASSTLSPTSSSSITTTNSSSSTSSASSTLSPTSSSSIITTNSSSSTSSTSSTLSPISSSSIITTNSSSSTSSASTLSLTSSSSITTTNSSSSIFSASSTLSPTSPSSIITTNSSSSTSSASTLPPTSSSSIITTNSSSSTSSASSTLSPTSSSSIITTNSSSSLSSDSSTLPPTSSSASSSSVTTPPSRLSLPSSPSSSAPFVVPTSLIGSSSSSSVASTLPSSASYSSVSSSGSSIGVTLPVPTGSISPSGPSLALSISASISPSVIFTPVSGSSTSPTSIPPVLVDITTSGSAPSVLKSSPLVTLLGGPVSIGLSSGSPIPLLPSSASLNPATSLAPVTLAPGSPASLPSASGSFSLSPSPIILEITSGSTSLTDAPTPISPAAPISPSTLSKVPSGSSVSSASVPAASLTTPSESSTISAINSASPGLLQSIGAPGSLGPSGTGGGGGGGGGRPRPTDDPKTLNAQPDIWPVTQIILGDYTPLIVARGFLILLNALYHQLETYEPIRQLLIPGGGSLVDHPVMMPIQFAMICAHIGTGFSAGATFFDTSYCNPGQTSDIKICPPRLSVNPWVIDVIIVVLIVQALTIVFVITQWWKKPSGFSADPTSIAGIAAFMGHPEVEQEFVLLPTEISTAGLKRRLRGKKFRLGQFATERGDVKYGIMPADDENEPTGKDGFFDKLKDWWAKLQGKYSFLHNWKKNRLLFDAFFVALLLALLGLIIDAVSRVNKTEVVFLATTAASGTGWRISIAILGAIVSCYWKRLFRDAQTFAPYINLGRGSSNPDATILLKRHSIPFTAFLPLLWHRHYTPASVAFIGLIAELLVVALSGLPYRPGQQRGEFLFWGITSLVILTIMVAQLISISMWRRKLPHLPRAPESIAAVMPYVAGTSMSRDFNGLEQLKRHERDKAIRDLEKSYAYGWRKEEDGRVRWIVDEVPRSKDRAALIDGADHFS